jgi:hypothetical protein
MPMLPASMAASSLRMSPNRFSVRITSKSAGRATSCMAALSTSRCSSLTSGNSRAVSTTTSRQSCETSRMFALSTDVTFFRRVRAASNATRAMRRISATE